MKRILYILLFFCGSVSWSQNIYFMKSFGNSGYDFGRDILQTPDTGYIATGSSSSFVSGNADAFLLKLDSLGNFTWSYNYGGQGSDWGNAVVNTNDSAFAIGGFSNSQGAGGFDFYLVKTDVNGVPEWQQFYGGSDWDKCFDMIQMADSGFVMVGETYSFGSGLSDGYIIRTNKIGDTLWTKTIGGVQDDYFRGVYLDGDSIVAVGATYSWGMGDSDGWIIKLDDMGNVGWQKYAGGVQPDYFTSVIKNDNYYIIGGSRSTDYVNSKNDFWVYYLTEDGQMVLADTSWGGDQFGHDIVNDVAVDPYYDAVFYGGSTTSWGSPDVADGVPDFFISKFNPAYTWMPYVQNFGTVGEDVLYGMDFCFDKGLIAIGDIDLLSTGGSNVLIIKIDENNSYGFSPDAYVYVALDSITTGLSTSNIDFKIYPNPFSDILQFSNPVSEISVYDLTGKIVYRHPENTSEIYLNQLPLGLYLIDFNLNGEIVRTKIIKG